MRITCFIYFLPHEGTNNEKRLILREERTFPERMEKP